MLSVTPSCTYSKLLLVHAAGFLRRSRHSTAGMSRLPLQMKPVVTVVVVGVVVVRVVVVRVVVEVAVVVVVVKVVVVSVVVVVMVVVVDVDRDVVVDVDWDVVELVDVDVDEAVSYCDWNVIAVALKPSRITGSLNVRVITPVFISTTYDTISGSVTSLLYVFARMAAPSSTGLTLLPDVSSMV